MSLLGGTSGPRRRYGFGGEEVRAAQSRGLWPGLRRTFLEGREEGERVDVEGASEPGVGERLDFVVGGVRRVEAVEGGGRREEVGLGMAGFEAGRGGGGIVEGKGAIDGEFEIFGLPFGIVGGGGIACLSLPSWVKLPKIGFSVALGVVGSSSPSSVMVPIRGASCLTYPFDSPFSLEPLFRCPSVSRPSVLSSALLVSSFDSAGGSVILFD